jgi:hypothetical protein
MLSTITIYISKVVIVVGHVHMLINGVWQENKSSFPVDKESHNKAFFWADVSF